MFIVAANLGVHVCSMFCYVMLIVLSSLIITLMGKMELVALHCLYFLCLVTVMVLWPFLTVPLVCRQCII